MFDQPNFAIEQVATRHTSVVFHNVENWFAEALARNDSLLSLAYLKHSVLFGHMKLWVVLDRIGCCAAFITNVIEMPKGRVLELVCIGGTRMSRWAKLVDHELMEIARSENCLYVVGHGRRGWLRFLLSLGTGWYQGPITMMRKVTHG